MDNLQEALMALAWAAVSALAAYAATWLRDRAARLRLDGALGRAAGQVLASPAVQQAGVIAMGAAAEDAAAYVLRSIPSTLRQLAVPPGRVREMVEGEVGKLLVGTVPSPAQAAVAQHVGAGKQ